MATVEYERSTRETSIKAKLTSNAANAELIGTTGIGFFDHMLNSMCVHGSFRIELDMTGDLHVDGHHTVEDTGIVLGKLFQKLRENTTITRFGNAVIPMDDALAMCTVDAGGRAYLVYDISVTAASIGGYDTQLTREFFYAFASNSCMTVHIKTLYGENDHHKIEAAFKAFAKALSAAYVENDGRLMSSKGVLD